jgi:hypothetical protein
MSRGALARVALVMTTRAAALAALFVASFAPTRLSAQTSVVVDEATFSIKGAAVGRESFRIIRAPGSGGQVFRAQATSSLGELRLQSTLSTDSGGSPVSYEMRVTQRGEQLEFLQGRGRPDRFSVLVQTKSGEAGGEYRIRHGTVLLDDQLFHQFYFVALAALESPDSVVTIISARQGSQSKDRLEFRGLEPVPVGGRNLAGRRFALLEGTNTRAELWIDAAGRLLKITVPDKALTALRDDPPR